MNYLSIVSEIVGIITVYGPKVESVITEIPDIIAKGTDAATKIKSGNFTTAETDVLAILKDLGISLSAVQLSSVLKKAKDVGPDAPVAHAA